MHKAHWSQLPRGIQENFLFATHDQRTRQSALNFIVKRKSNKIQNLRLSVKGPYIWNKLPNYIKEINGQTKFKNTIRKFAEF